MGMTENPSPKIWGKKAPPPLNRAGWFLTMLVFVADMYGKSVRPSKCG